MTEDNSTMFQKLSSQFSQGWKLLIQPQKHEYALEELGRPVIVLNGAKYNRHDYSVGNRRGQRLECSYFECMELIGQGKEDIGTGNASTRVGSSAYNSEQSNGFAGQNSGKKK